MLGPDSGGRDRHSRHLSALLSLIAPAVTRYPCPVRSSNLTPDRIRLKQEASSKFSRAQESNKHPNMVMGIRCNPQPSFPNCNHALQRRTGPDPPETNASIEAGPHATPRVGHPDCLQGIPVSHLLAKTVPAAGLQVRRDLLPKTGSGSSCRHMKRKRRSITAVRGRELVAG